MDITKKSVFIFILLLIVVVFGVYTIFISTPDAIRKFADYYTSNSLEKGDLDKGSENDDRGINIGGFGSSGGAGGSAGGAGSSGGSTSVTCTREQISYSLTDFDPKSICNLFQGSDCIEKSITCRAKVRNLDLSVGGDFGIQFSLHKAEDINSTFDGGSNTGFVGANQSSIITLSRIVNSTYANFDISCSSITTSVPYNEICV